MMMKSASKKQAGPPHDKNPPAFMNGLVEHNSHYLDGEFVNKHLVVREGVLHKRGSQASNRYDEFYFVLEQRDKNGIGPLLKYGKVGHPVSKFLDLGTSKDLKIKKDDLVLTDLSISLGELQILSLRAQSIEDRNSWYTALTTNIKSNN
jgi:hypothetical protein